MSASVPSLSRAMILPPLKKHRTRQCLQVRAQSLRDEGRSSSNLVDSSMKILRDRIEEVKMKERLERSWRREEYYGWNDVPYYHKENTEEENLSEHIKMLGVISGTSSLAILSGSAVLCLVSLIAHLNL